MNISRRLSIREKMKKRIIILFSLLAFILMLTGCTMNNSPRAKVETILMKYQKNSDSVVSELNDYLDTLNIPDDSHEEYKKIYLKQYSDLKYNIKDEMIDGDTATVTVQIEVYDYYKIENVATKYINDNPDKFSTNDVYDSTKVLEYKLDKFNNAKDRVTYRINFNLTKIDNEWTVDNLSNEDLEKIHGIYAH